MTTRYPKRLGEQLCELLPIYKTIDLKVQAVGDLLKTRVPYISGNTNHLGTMHAGVIWMAGEVLGGLAYFGHSQELGKLGSLSKRWTLSSNILLRQQSQHWQISQKKNESELQPN